MKHSLFTGILSGLIVAGFVLVFGVLWKSSIVPWYESRVYQGISLAGRWECVGTDRGHSFRIVTDVKQHAHRLWGHSTYVSQGQKSIIYAFEANFNNFIVCGRFWDNSISNLDRGTFTLMVRKDGKLMKGHEAYYDEDKQDIVTQPYEWKKLE